MPGMTGVDFLQQALTIYPEAKRVLLTAYADTRSRHPSHQLRQDPLLPQTSPGTPPKRSSTPSSTTCSKPGSRAISLPTKASSLSAPAGPRPTTTSASSSPATASLTSGSVPNSTPKPSISSKSVASTTPGFPSSSSAMAPPSSSPPPAISPPSWECRARPSRSFMTSSS